MDKIIPEQTPWQIQKNVVFALFLRELKNRFSHFRLGYIWAIGEPVALITVLCALRLALGKGPIAGVPFPLFFATGIVPFLIYQTSVSQCLSVIESNLPLMNYRVVKPADPIIAKCMLELIKYTTSGVFIIVMLVLIGYRFQWNNTIGIISVFCCLSIFTLGVCLLIGVIGAFIHESKKIIPILTRPLFFISGIFFAADSLPLKYREILLWNPLLHATELSRQYIFADFENSHGNLFFLVKASLLSFGIGLLFYYFNRIKLATSGLIK
jgi:capsular polysaccharide transport system permease protein